MPARFDPLAEIGELSISNLPECLAGLHLPWIRGTEFSQLGGEIPLDGFQHCVEEPHVRASSFHFWLGCRHVFVVHAWALHLFFRCHFCLGRAPCSTSKTLYPSAVTRVQVHHFRLCGFLFSSLFVVLRSSGRLCSWPPCVVVHRRVGLQTAALRETHSSLCWTLSVKALSSSKLLQFIWNSNVRAVSACVLVPRDHLHRCSCLMCFLKRCASLKEAEHTGSRHEKMCFCFHLFLPFMGTRKSLHKTPPNSECLHHVNSRRCKIRKLSRTFGAH